MRLLLLMVVVVLSLPSAAAAAPSAAPAKTKCSVVKVKGKKYRRCCKRVAVRDAVKRKCTRRPVQSGAGGDRGKTGGGTGGGTTGGGTTGGGTGGGTTGGGTTGQPGSGTGGGVPAGWTSTRDDAAGQQALAAGDLLLERASFGSVTAEYDRIFLYANGAFGYYRVNYNTVSGEICDGDRSRRGTWQFAEAYRFRAPDGTTGTLVVLSVQAGTASRDGLVFPDNSDKVGLVAGNEVIPFDRNPNMRDSC